MIDAAYLRLSQRVDALERDLDRRRVEVAHAPIVLLDIDASSDLWSGGGLTGSSWSNALVTFSPFTVQFATSIIEITFRGHPLVISTVAAVGETAARISLDSNAVTRKIGGDGWGTVSQYQNPMAGAAPVKLTGLAVGSHTPSVQIWVNQANCIMYCRCATQPDIENFGIQVVEYPR